MNATESERRPRSDAGVVRWTARDLSALAWLDDMRAITEADLARLLGTMGRTGRALSIPAAQAVVRRWTALRVATSALAPVGAGTARVVQLTPAGGQLVGGHATKPVPATAIPHTVAVAHARIELVDRIGTGHVLEWRSERALMREWSAAGQGRGAGHRPDALMVLGPADSPTPCAVEVELTMKQAARRVELLGDLMTDARWAGVYVVVRSKAHESTIRQAVEEAKIARRSAVRLHPVRTVVMESLP